MAKRAAGGRTATSRRATVTTAARLRALESQVEQNRRELELQFHRISQIQAELDRVKQAWERMKGSGSARS